MELLAYFQGLLVGLLGWAATGLWALGAARLSEGERRVMIVCSWVVWMLPALGTLVLRGVLNMTGLMVVGALSTAVLALALIGGGQRWRTKP